MSNEKKNICKDCVSSAYINFRPYCNHNKRFLEKPLNECENFDGGGVIYAPYIIADVSGADTETYKKLAKNLNDEILKTYDEIKSEPFGAVLEKYHTEPVVAMCFLTEAAREHIWGKDCTDAEPSPNSADELLVRSAYATYVELMETGIPSQKYTFVAIGTKGAIENELRRRWENGFDQDCPPTEEGGARLEKVIALYLESRQIADDLYYMEQSVYVANVFDMSCNDLKDRLFKLGAIGAVNKKWSPRRIADEWKRINKI